MPVRLDHQNISSKHCTMDCDTDSSFLAVYTVHSDMNTLSWCVVTDGPDFIIYKHRPLKWHFRSLYNDKTKVHIWLMFLMNHEWQALSVQNIMLFWSDSIFIFCNFIIVVVSRKYSFIQIILHSCNQLECRVFTVLGEQMGSKVRHKHF